jgi:transcriptional regulator with XRE-family HTH domain
MRISETGRSNGRHTAACASTGDRLREWRLRRERSQQEVAYRAGITQGALSNYETGKRHLPLYTALAVAAALDITIGDILDNVEDVIVLDDSRLARAIKALVERPDMLALLAQMHLGEADRPARRTRRVAVPRSPSLRTSTQRHALGVRSPAA